MFRLIYLVIFFVLCLNVYSRYDISLKRTIDIEGQGILTASKSYIYDIIEDEFNQSIRIDKISISDTGIVESKILYNYVLLGIDKSKEFPYLLLSKSSIISIVSPFENHSLKFNQPPDLSITSNNFKYFKEFGSFLFDDKLYQIENGKEITSLNLIKDNVYDVVIFKSSLWTIEQVQNNLILQNIAYPENILRFEYSEKAKLLANNNILVLLSYFEKSTYMSVVDENMQVTDSKWLEKVNSFDYDNLSIQVATTNGLYYWEGEKQHKIFKDRNILHSTIDTNTAIGLGSDEIFIKNDSYKISNQTSFNLSQILKTDNQLILLNKDATLVYELSDDTFWIIEYVFVDNYQIIILTILIIFIFILAKRVNEKNTMLSNVFNLSSTGIIIHIDKNRNIQNINVLGKELLELPESVPMGKYFTFYLKSKSFNELKSLIIKSLNLKEEYKQKINLIIDSNLSEYICSITIIKSFGGAYNGLIINAVDITEQLERKRLSNWAQLAHDMQTNLSTIKLNSEQIDTSENYDNAKRIKKIQHQTNLLINRVRDIITVGRNPKIDKNENVTQSIFSELIEEFDLNDKNLNLILEIENFKFSCDRNKILRALRNAIENALKAMPKENKELTFGAKRDNRFVLLTVKDNGAGMDKKTKENMLNPYYTRGSKGGTGIGTMIMKNAIEQHGGEIIINSEPDLGTELIFKIPNLNR